MKKNAQHLATGFITASHIQQKMRDSRHPMYIWGELPQGYCCKRQYRDIAPDIIYALQHLSTLEAALSLDETPGLPDAWARSIEDVIDRVWEWLSNAFLEMIDEKALSKAEKH